MKYLVALPPVRHVGPQFLVTNHLPHLLYGGVGGHKVIVGQLVLFVNTCSAKRKERSASGFTFLFGVLLFAAVSALTSCVAATCDLPVHQAECINVSALKGIKMFHVDGFV